jgi:hypothetical protein
MVDGFVRPLVHTAIYSAALHNQFEMVDWLCKELNVSGNEIRFEENLMFRTLCSLKRPKMIQHLDDIFCFTLEDAKSFDHYALKTAIIFECKETLQWLLRRFSFSKFEIQNLALRCAVHNRKSKKMTRWLLREIECACGEKHGK